MHNPVEIKTADDAMSVVCDQKTPIAIRALIHPDAARALLELNTRNRTLNPGRVNSLVQALKHNEWLLVNNGIAVDTEGDLLDGQHRLQACINANRPIEVYLHAGSDPRGRLVIDTGRSRSLYDTFKSTGHELAGGSTNTAAAIRLLYRYHNGLITNRSSSGSEALSHSTLIAYSDQHIDLQRLGWISSRAKADSDNIPGVLRSAHTASLYLLYARDPYHAGAFHERLRSGVNLSSGDPELALRNVLARLGTNYRRGDWHLCVYLKAWNARVRDKKIQVLAMRENEQVPPVL